MKTLKEKKELAEQQAEMSRTIKQHIRREWYKSTNKSWMRHFPRIDTPKGVLPMTGILKALLFEYKSDSLNVVAR